MKITIKTITLLTVLNFVLIGCKKEEEVAPKTNFFTLDATEYSLKHALTIENGGDNITGYNFSLVITSAGIDLSTFEEKGLKSGKGELLYFELWSTSSTDLSTNTYSFNSESAKPDTYNYSFIGINYDHSKDINEEVYDSATGNIIVKVEDSTYTIDFDLTLSGGEKVMGNYTGKIINYLD